MDQKRNVKQFLLFTLLSLSAGLIDYLSGILLKYAFNLTGEVSQYISVALSVIWNFTFNRKFTFKSASNLPIAMLKVLVFYLVFIPLSGLLTKYLTDQLGWSFALVKAGTMIVNFVGEFFYWKYFVFRDSLNKEQPKQEEQPAQPQQDNEEH